jgi:hypothetical protein
MANISLKQTKAVIFKAYQEAITEAKRLKSEVSTINQALSKSKAAYNSALQQANSAKKSSKSNVQKESTPKEIIKVVTKIGDIDNLNGVIGALNTIQDSIGAAISQCANMQMIEAEQLEVLQKNIEDCQTQLKDLYDVDFDDDTLENIVKEYETTKETFTEAFDEQKATYEEQFTEKIKDWRKEQLLYNIELKERNDADNTEQKREQTEYKYQLTLERNLETDIYEQKHKGLQEELNETRDNKLEEFKVLEEAVKEREVEFSDYKTKYEELPKRLEKAIKTAEHIGTSIIERDAKVKMNLLKREVENESNTNVLKINSLNSFITKQESQIARLTAQLETAMKQAQNLAIKAIEGTANAESFDAMKAIAMEQAKYNSKSK